MKGRYGNEGRYDQGGITQAGSKQLGRQGYDGAERERSFTSGSLWPSEGPYAGRGPKGYERSSERITEDVCERLTWSGSLDASNIEVKADGDEVTLEGTVDSRQAKRIAEDLAESATGVRDVHNRLRIKQENEEETSASQQQASSKSSQSASSKKSSS